MPGKRIADFAKHTEYAHTKYAKLMYFEPHPPYLTASLTTWSNGLKTVLKSFLE